MASDEDLITAGAKEVFDIIVMEAVAAEHWAPNEENPDEWDRLPASTQAVFRSAARAVLQRAGIVRPVVVG